ncbi:hypothetical protein PR048_007473 [Dryococelus australis]|uniref:Forkhead box protein N3 n=1 Tax=Dryococelus australis TaxID=614101 RepID=A0ABQ9HUC6_9NEOP|nr:hypothetical protein PR048_007473 [Dryococelus australis]
MAPERPGPDDDAATLVHRGPVSIPVVPIFSLPSAIVQLKEGDGAGNLITAVKVEDVMSEERESNEDDDLTSLSWLQDKNLLKAANFSGCVQCFGGVLRGVAQVSKYRRGVGAGMNIRAAETQESPTSDYVEDGGSDLADSTSSSGHSASPAPGSSTKSTPSTCPTTLWVHDMKGAFTTSHKFSCYFGSQDLNVKICPNLSYSFFVIEMWAAREQIHVHTNSKPPYSFSCLIFMAIEDSPVKALPVKEIYAWILDHFPYFQNAPTGWKNSVRHNLSLNKCFRKVEKAPNLGKGSLWMVDSLYRPNLVQALQKAPYHPYTSSEHGGGKEYIPSSAHLSRHNTVAVFKSSQRAPRPGTLVPRLDMFLPRRQQPEDVDDPDSLDDVDAAAAMLALKHGHRVITLDRGQLVHTVLKRWDMCLQDTPVQCWKQLHTRDPSLYCHPESQRSRHVNTLQQRLYCLTEPLLPPNKGHASSRVRHWRAAPILPAPRGLDKHL